MAISSAILMTMIKMSEPRKERFGTRTSPTRDIASVNRTRSKLLAHRMANGGDFLRESARGPLMIDTSDMFSIPSNMMREISKRTRDYGNAMGGTALSNLRGNPRLRMRGIAGHKAYDTTRYVIEDGSRESLSRRTRDFFAPDIGLFDSRNYPPKGGLTSPKS